MSHWGLIKLKNENRELKKRIEDLLLEINKLEELTSLLRKRVIELENKKERQL